MCYHGQKLLVVEESITSLQTSSIPLFLQLGKKISNILTYWKFCNNEITVITN
jgi:hypothetical protein